jgi:ankyrin repeat protein
MKMKKTYIFLTLIILQLSIYAQSDLDFKLLIAADKSDNDSVLSLLKAGANPNTKTWEGVTPLMYASENGNIEICKSLISNGADVNIQPNWGSNALIAASQYNHPDVVELLILNEAKFNLKDDLGYNAISYAVAYGFIDVTETLLYYGASHEMKCNNTDPMMIAAYYGDTLMMEILLFYNADINSKDDEGLTPLMIAAQNNYLDAVEYLVKKGAKINDVNKQNHSALSIATINKNSEITELLISYGAKVDIKDNQGLTPYTISILNNDVKTKKILKKANSEKNKTLLVNKVTFSFLNNFNDADYMLGMDFGLHEAITNIYFYSGLLYRPFHKNIIFQETQNLYYQLKEQRTNILLGLEKHFSLYDLTKKTKFGILIGFKGIFSYGEYKSTYKIIEDRYLYSPYAGIFLNSKISGLKIYYEFCEMAGIKTSPHRITISLSFNFDVKKVNHTNKDLYWF